MDTRHDRELFGRSRYHFLHGVEVHTTSASCLGRSKNAPVLICGVTLLIYVLHLQCPRNAATL